MVIARSALLSLLLPLAAMACSAAPRDDDSDDDGEMETSSDEAALSSAVSCDRERQPAYSGGSNIGTMDVVKVGGKRVGIKTAHAFLKLQKAAAAQGVDVWINSGFRTMDEQRYFYGCYQSGNCNNGNLAARPGFSNHQNGRALDLGTSNRSRLNQIISQQGLDWRRTVPSEAWHYEYFGGNVSGPCDGGGAAPDEPSTPPSSGCYSPTLGRRVAQAACVQGAATGAWFQCDSGSWERGVNGSRGPVGACSASHPL